MAVSPRRFKRPKFERAAWREWFIIIVPAILLSIAAFAITSRFIQPAPPDTFVFSAGAEGGAYYRYALQYQELLKRDGIKLDVKTSAGSPENLARMRGDTPEASAGFVQGGTTQPQDSNTMLSLGRMFYEPIWVFHRLPDTTERLTDLRGKRVAVGPAGSGTRELVLQLLELNGVGAANTTLLELSSKDAINALKAKKIDAAFFVAAPEADTIQSLLRIQEFKLMNFSRAEAYARRFPWLARVVLHQGVIDFRNDIPARDVQLLAAVAIIGIRDDLHPALHFALTQAAAEVHKKSSLLNAEKHFPQSQDSELAMSAAADRFHKNGAPFLQRYLPFWIAVLVDRLLVMLIPLLTIMVPLIKIVPYLYTWRIRKRLWHWYNELKHLEHDIAALPAEREKHIAELARIDSAVHDIPVPLQYSEQYYTLRAHVEYVQRRLMNQPAPADAATS
jgi:TRAP transporter TAXI family solute receptor